MSAESIPPFDVTLTDTVRKVFEEWRAEVSTSAPRDLAGNSGMRGTATKRMPPLGIIGQFTRDAGMFRSGYMLSGSFERCFTLALRFGRPEANLVPRPYDHAAALACCLGAFGDDLDFVWVEPPATDSARRVGLHVYRLFVGPDWATPVTGTPPTGGYVPWPEWRLRVLGGPLIRSATP